MLDHIAWDVGLVDGRDIYGNIVYIYGDIVGCFHQWILIVHVQGTP